MAHNPFPFRHDSHPDLTTAIRGVMSESHTRAQLEKLSITRLRELKKKYEERVLKGDRDAARELADIRGLLRSRGAGVVVDEGVSPCEAAALARLKAANAEDLKEKPGAAAHKRLHKTIQSVVEGASGQGKYPRPGASGGVRAGDGTPPRPAKPKPKYKYPGGVVHTRYATEGVSPCEKAAMKRLRDAEAADLKEYPGKRGEAAPARLHKTVKSVVGEGVIRDTVQRVKNKLRGAGGRTDAELDAMPKRVFMPANPRAVRQQKLEDSKKPGTTWDSKPDEFGQQRIGAKNADGDVRYFRSSERGRAESWARGRTKHKRANFPGDPYAALVGEGVIRDTVQRDRNP